MRVDVVIAGAGIVGLTLAAALGRNGLRVVVLEPQQRPSPLADNTAVADWDRRVSALTPASEAFLDKLGVWQAMAGQRLAAYDRMLVWDAEGTGEIEFTAGDANTHRLGHIVENRVTVAALLRVVEQLPAVTLLWGEGLDSVQPDGTASTVVHTTAAGQLETALLIAADGARSPVRSKVGLKTRAWSYHQRGIVATVRLAASHEHCCYQAFLASGPLALLPLAAPDLCSIVWSIDEDQADDLLMLNDNGFKDALNRALLGRSLTVVEVGERAAFPLKQCHAVDYVAARTALVGDAAHSIHPLAGQGVNLGLADARVLAQEITTAYLADTDWGSLSVLARYQRQRKGENLAMMAAMQAFKEGFGSQSPSVRVLRNFGLSWVDGLTPLKRRLMTAALGG